MSELADALHDDLGFRMCCESHLDASTTAVTHDLSDEWWEKIADSAREWVKALWGGGELPEWLLSSLRSHAFSNCHVCNAAVDDPEAIYACGSLDGPAAVSEECPDFEPGTVLRHHVDGTHTVIPAPGLPHSIESASQPVAEERG